jgi:parvulin-like peptidyl-prolyl isomerase
MRARSGEDFSKLAIKYSEDPTVKENLGKTGLMVKGHYPEYDGVAFSLPEEGSVSDPFKVPRGWVVVKIERIESSSTPTLPEAKSTIQRSLMEEKADKILMEKLEKWREGYPITIYDNNLEKAELKRTRL